LSLKEPRVTGWVAYLSLMYATSTVQLASMRGKEGRSKCLLASLSVKSARRSVQLADLSDKSRRGPSISAA